MKSVLSLTSIVFLVGSVIPVAAQGPDALNQTIVPAVVQESSLNEQLRAADAHRITRGAGGRVEEASGLLVSDPRRRYLWFEVDDETTFWVSYDRIAAMHHETAVEPSKWGWPLKVTKYYVTIHYADSEGRLAFETLRLSEHDTPVTLGTLETHTGVRIDRTLARASFLGIPIRAAIGDRVTITDHSGQTSEGTIMALSASSIALDGSTGVRVFDRATVSRISHRRSRGRDAAKGFAIGAVIGAVTGGVAGRGLGGDGTAAFEGAALFGAAWGGMGALLSVAIPSYRFRATRDVYLADTRSASRPLAITIAPQASRGTKGVALSLRF
jgi:hypothetical protein